MIRAGSDIGGTFTDVILFDAESSTIKLAKVPSSSQLGDAVLEGIAATKVDVDELDVLVHGSTVVINALLERKGVSTALITTEGFRDVYEIGRINRPDSFNVFFQKHEPLVARKLRFEVKERLLPGEVVEILSDTEIARVIEEVRAAGVDAVAIMLLHSFMDPTHEIKLQNALRKALPELFISSSHELTREYREYERTSTVVANAYVGPIVDHYLAQLANDLQQKNFSGQFYLMQSNGGLIGETEARKDCISLIESGPAGGVIGTQEVLTSIGLSSGVAFDMGGTTAKAGVVEDGVPRVGHQYFIGSYNTGLPVLTPVMDIHEVGTGGGSIASVTQYGELRVGPQSAGATPGPACYQKGGSLATVTDANVVLGRLSTKLPLASNMQLDPNLARAAVEQHVAIPLGVSVEEAAAGIVRVANTTMAYSISAVTVERGLSPQDFVLVAYGGAGPLHATQVARELTMEKVVIPPSPGVFSAYGMLFAEPQGHAARTQITALDSDSISGLAALTDELIAEAGTRIGLAGRDADTVELVADMRYVGQEHTVDVPLTVQMITSGDGAAIKSRFDKAHQRAYSHSAAEEPAQIVTLRAVVSMHAQKPSFSKIAASHASAEPSFFDDVYLEDKVEKSVAFYSREELVAEQVITGPAVIFEETASTLLLAGEQAEVHEFGHLLIELGGA